VLIHFGDLPPFELKLKICPPPLQLKFQGSCAVSHNSLYNNFVVCVYLLIQENLNGGD